MTMVISGSDGVTFPDSTTQNTTDRYGFVNRIINGDMRIDQRNAGAAVTTSGALPVDRFVTSFTSSVGAFSAQQDSSVPAGFTTSTKVTITTADASIAAGENLIIQQWVEGNNIADLGFGSANAKTVTLSFWVRSSVTGTFCVMIGNSSSGTGAPNRSYVAEYTINSANTWEQKTITIAGDTSGTWQTNNTRGMVVRFCLTAGSDYVQSAGSWGTVNAACSLNQTQLLSTLNATWYVTGVQLEVGSVATPFERRPYGTELALCRRYYYRAKSVSADSFFGNSYNQTTTQVLGITPFFVEMRTTPTALEQSGTAGDYRVNHANTNTTCSSVPTLAFATPWNAGTFMTVASGLTAGQGSMMRAVNSSAFLAWSAEL
jgi:hypothetical protein